MGSWNNTCGLTNLPIHSGEAVYVFPIKEKDLSKYRSHCYSTAFYQPMLLPFVAEYNDYGAGENCTGVGLDLFVDELRRELVEMEVGENEYHDIAVKKEGFNIDTFFEAVHEDRLFVKGWGATPRPVYFTMVRKDVVDRMWNEWTYDIYTGKGKGSDPDSYYEHDMSYAKIAQGIQPFLESVAKNLKAEAAGTAITDRYFRRGMMLRELKDDDNFLSGILRSFENHEFWDLLYVREVILKCAENDEIDRAVEFLRMHTIGVMVNSMMESTRKIWTPVMHMGSQSEQTDEYRLMHQLANDVLTARETYYKDQCSEDDDYDDDLFSAQGIYLTSTGFEQ